MRFKFRSEVTFDTVAFDGAFVGVGELKRLIAEKRRLDPDAANELVLMSMQNADYKDDSEQLPKSSSVLVKRAPAFRSKGLPGQQAAASQAAAAVAAAKALDQAGSYQASLGTASYADPGTRGGDTAEAAAAAYTNEDDMIKSLVEGSASRWAEGSTVGPGRGRGRGFAGRGAMAGPGGRGMFLKGAIPPPNYVCSRCGRFGHYLRDCPTHNDPNFVVKPVRTPAGIPNSMLKRAADGGILLPDGSTGFLAENEDARKKEFAFLTRAAAGEDSAAAGDAKTSSAAIKDQKTAGVCSCMLAGRLCSACRLYASVLGLWAPSFSPLP